MRIVSENKESGNWLRLTAHGEELIEARDEDGVENTQQPHAESVDRHGGLINARDRSADFRVWRFTDRI